jgi:3-deoxy-D-manno-octulosonate 8-phosphate phosphatase (KDO 8-P phosphatase)
MESIKNLILDVDGVLTDGGFYYTTEGKVMKKFGSDDSDALKLLEGKLNVVAITADSRGFDITKKRTDDMGLKLELVSTSERLAWIEKNFKLEETIYMADGILDWPIFEKVAYSIAPANAFDTTKRKATFVTEKRGGEGAVAEAVMHILYKFFKNIKSCFFTVYSPLFKDMGKSLVRSIKRFYPDIPVIEFEFSPPTTQDTYHGVDLQVYNRFVLEKGKELLKEYGRIIWIDADSLMTSECPDLFNDADMLVPANNWPVLEDYSNRTKVYVNAGLVVCTNPCTWQEWIDDLDVRDKKGFDVLNFNNSLDWLFHNSKSNIKLLEYKDRTYGISVMSNYINMELKGGDLYVAGRKICIFHAAGDQWKRDGYIIFDHILNKEAMNHLKSLGEVI